MSSPAAALTVEDNQGRKRARKDRQEPVDEVNEFNRNHQHPGSNLTLISSDGLQFRVHRLQIMAASPFYSSMMETVEAEDGKEGEDRIFFADDEIENSVCISGLLDIIYGKDGIVSCSPKKMALPRLVQLLKKYECGTALTTLKFLVRSEAATSGTGPDKIHTRAYFLAATYMDDVQGAAEAIKRGDGDLFTPMIGAKRSEKARTTDNIVWMGALNPEAMGEASLAEIPMKYLVALIRSRKLVTNEKIKKDGWRKTFEEVAREFVAILTRQEETDDVPQTPRPIQDSQ